ncbi:MAG: hypothetical protein E3J56_14785 [Candidatus Aminicenantes bacterium]|nr:MAG: hypothetical protein E3J56_14785 [Candidatus Aminicenantes bacterium]
MRTIKKLSFFGILVIVIGLLFLIGMSTSQAQDQAKGKPDKPDKPPGKPDKPGEETTWAVRIPTKTEAMMFYGMNLIDGKSYYLNNDKDIEISVKKEKMAGPWRKYYDFSYAFKFSLTNNNAGTGISPDYFVGFQYVESLDLIEYPDPDKPCCQFPTDLSCVEGGGYECDPSCLATFLNNAHPYSDGIEANDYEFFWIRYTIFDFDIEQMELGDKYLIGSSSDSGEPGDSFLMKTQYRQGCQKEPAFHNVELRRTVNPLDDGQVNIWIERLNKIQYELDYRIQCEKVWRIRVEVINGNDYLCVKEIYCTPYKKQTFYTPIKAKGNFFFYVDFIKNPE